MEESNNRPSACENITEESGTIVCPSARGNITEESGTIVCPSARDSSQRSLAEESSFIICPSAYGMSKRVPSKTLSIVPLRSIARKNSLSTQELRTSHVQLPHTEGHGPCTRRVHLH
eukprot:TRINITY_DN74823_c0_g1_i1.p1 TRINITY_DN74823_c0_g1~~TRINITY_DN74823_c0_g1_i1.p1  ORF type:complete len:117 (-),score=4.85 TRINITY_DN74823_c0_g1_i1:181-531(-)